jgi:hypothetical protein
MQCRDRLKPGGWYGPARNGRSGEWDGVARHGGVDRGRRHPSARMRSAVAAFGSRRRNIAANGGCALIVGRNGCLRTSARRLPSLFGKVEVRASRFSPCRCAVTHHRHTLNPVAEIMPDRCTPEYECVIAKMGSLLPYRRAGTLLSGFLPLGDLPAVETSRRRTMRVGARLEQQAVASQPPAPAAEAQAIALSIDGGHMRSVRTLSGPLVRGDACARQKR